MPHSVSSVPHQEPETLGTVDTQPLLGESNREKQLTRFPFSDLRALTFAKWPNWVRPPPLSPCHPALGPWCRAAGRRASLSGCLSPQFLCTVIAILLHYVYMSTFAWTFVESLHIHRMLTEVRNIDAGPMRFYYVVGWGIPAIVTGEDAQSSPARGPGLGTDRHSGDLRGTADAGSHVR